MVTNITKGELGNYVVTGEFEIPAKISADSDAKAAGESTNVTLRFRLIEEPLENILSSSLKDKRINAQATMRKKSEAYREGQVVTLDYKGGKGPVDAEAAMMSRLKAMTPEARDEWFEEKRKQLGLTK